MLGALLDPGFLRFPNTSARNQIRTELLKHMLPQDADDVQAIAQLSSVHEWKPNLPVRLFHGRDDSTVPYASSLTTLQTMQALGAGDLVSLTDCPAVPSEHIACVPSFLAFMLAQVGAQALDFSSSTGACPAYGCSQQQAPFTAGPDQQVSDTHAGHRLPLSCIISSICLKLSEQAAYQRTQSCMISRG